MNNNIIQTIYVTARVGAILGFAFFAFASDALAAPTLVPVTVSEITSDKATITSKVSNPQRNSTVWFELNNNNNAPTSVAVQGIWNEGTFQWTLRDLTPGQTYSFRAVATDAGNTVYSPTNSFTVPVSKAATPTSISYQSSPVIAMPAQAPVIKAAEVKTEVVPAVKQATSTPVAPKEGFENNSSASVIGGGSGIIPTTLIGWMLLLVSLLVLSIIAHMIYTGQNKPQKAVIANKVDEEKDGHE